MENNERSLLTAKLETTLAQRKKSISAAIKQIELTGTMLDDYVKPVRDLRFDRDIKDGDVRMSFNYNDYDDAGVMLVEKNVTLGLHKHAVGQIGDKFGIPPGFLRDLTTGENWQRNLSTTIMQEHADNVKRERVLIRSVGGQVRGFLSDRYRRLDSMQIFIAFLIAAQDTGSVLIDAHNGETKSFIEVISPKIIAFDTPKNGRNYATIGARIRKSDFGDGALELYIYAMMVKCWNGLVGNTMLREVHLGGRIPENIRISNETYQKDTEANASVVADVMRQLYIPENVESLIGKIQEASAVDVDLVKEVERLPKLGLTVTESENVGKVLMENNPENGLQGNPTLWKLVNGLTAVARDSEPERRRELEKIAGEMLKM